ncbi:MAG: DUF2007 domain-containing protein [Vicingaceae bacterium]
MSEAWVKVFSSNDLFQAEIIKSMLDDEGITAVLINKKDSMHLHLTIGEAEVFVDDDKVIKARHLISKFEG